ncbi:MAG: four helix bundle protein [bacterium]|nr:four helix bundle protein [bacterium]
MEETKSTFETLEVWKKSRELRKEFSKFVKTLPVGERLKLGDQIIRASRSVTANIAEGYGRYHFQENIQFCRQARGSLYELLDHSTVALDEEYISEEKFNNFRIKIFKNIKILNGYISFLRRKKTLETT